MTTSILLKNLSFGYSATMPECGTLMDHNGSNSHTKRWLGIVKIGKYLCPKCQKNVTEACDFWKDAKKNFSEYSAIFVNF